MVSCPIERFAIIGILWPAHRKELLVKRWISLAVVASTLVSAAWAREWTSRSGGFSVEAELVDVKDGNVILKKPGGSQITVPMNKLSLGDVRYIGEVFKAAEAAVGNSKPEPAADDNVSLDARKREPLPAPLPAASIPELRYRWKQGQTYVYYVTVVSENAQYNESISGNVTFTVKSTNDDETQLVMTEDLKGGDKWTPVRIVVYPRHFVHAYAVPTKNEVTITLDPRGRVLHTEGSRPLPFLLGDLSQLIVEQLPADKQTTWTANGDSTTSDAEQTYPYYRRHYVSAHVGAPLTEKRSYVVTGQSGKSVTIFRRLELGTTNVVGNKPQFEAVGDGTLTFDTERGAFARFESSLRLVAREGGKTKEIPLRITYRLQSEEEIAKTAKAAEAARVEETRPMTDAEVEKAVADLASGDRVRVDQALRQFMRKKPRQPNAKAARALEDVMQRSENAGARSESAKALQSWSTAESVPALLKALKDDWAPARAEALEALRQYKPKEAIKPAAELLNDGFTRGNAGKFLKAMGPEAEDAVLAQFEAVHEPWTRAEICQVLQVIGTKKSVPVLEKAVLDENFMVNGNARKALSAIKTRD
jgi:hypothetical protein